MPTNSIINITAKPLKSMPLANLPRSTPSSGVHSLMKLLKPSVVIWKSLTEAEMRVLSMSGSPVIVPFTAEASCMRGYIDILHIEVVNIA